jgi:hypothetical protein
MSFGIDLFIKKIFFAFGMHVRKNPCSLTCISEWPILTSRSTRSDLQANDSIESYIYSCKL